MLKKKYVFGNEIYIFFVFNMNLITKFHFLNSIMKIHSGGEEKKKIHSEQTH